MNPELETELSYDEVKHQLDDLKENYKIQEDKLGELVYFFKQLSVIKLPITVRDLEPITIDALINRDTYVKINDLLKTEEKNEAHIEA